MKRLANLLCGLGLLLSLLAPASAGALEAPLSRSITAYDSRYFSETGFRISDDMFWDYFQKRGGIKNFGYPVSRKFLFLGSWVQFFQRRILQLRGDGTVGQLNILDQQFIPYTQANGSTFPSIDQSLLDAAPQVGSPNYATAILQFIKDNAPDNWNGLKVNFYQTFINTVTYDVAYPEGGGDPNWMPGINLEMWGVPTGKSAVDPNNHDFVYLRFQRGIMHYDKATGLTQGLLLADYLKAILTGNNLPPDLEAAAQGSRFYRQYNNAAANGLNRPADLPDTNLKDAFEKEGPTESPPTPVPTPTSGPTPAPTPGAASGMRYGMQVHLVHQDQPRVLQLVLDAGFNWIKHQVRWADVEPEKGNRNWGMLDPIVDNASARGIGILFSVLTAPQWSRAADGIDGPPDNLQDFGDFLQAMAARYKGRVQAYEIWNEQNFSREWGGGRIDAGAYVEMLKVAYTRIKQADPNAIVLVGALTPTGYMDPNVAIDDLVYFEQMYQYQNGVIKSYSDAVGAHPGGFNNPPDDTPDHRTVSTTSFKGHWSFYFGRVKQLRDVMVRYGDGNKKIWFTEFGWSTANQAPGYEYGADNSEEDQARYIVRAFQLGREWGWVGAMFLWNLNFSTVVLPTDEKYPFSIIRGDWSPRPAYIAVRDMPKQ